MTAAAGGGAALLAIPIYSFYGVGVFLFQKCTQTTRRND